ncbi:MAG: FeoA family protein [Crocinitomicaceae bacterium]|nr:ferrous iron transport protein A [Crocinitomicaceae bacterium]
MTLVDLHKGQSALIKDVQESEVLHKLYEFGILPGHTIELVECAPFNGPYYLKVDNNLIAIRKEEARQIII